MIDARRQEVDRVDAVTRQWCVALGEGVAVFAPDGGDATPRAKKARALIAFLAVAPEKLSSRAELIALLWSDRGHEQARASLRQCLFELRHDAPGLIEIDGETISLAAAVVANGAAAPRLTGLDGIAPGCDRWLEHRREASAVAPPAALGEANGPIALRRSSWAWGATVAVIVLLAALAAWWSLGRPPAPAGLTVIAVGPFTATADTAAAVTIAQRMNDDVRALLPAERAVVRVNDAPGNRLEAARRLGAEWVISGSVDPSVGAGRVHVQVETPDGQLIWVRDVDAAPGRLGDAAAIAATRIAMATGCALGEPRVQRSVDVLGLLLEACERLDFSADNYSHQVALVALRRLADRAPDDALAQAQFGTGLAVLAGDMPPALATAQRDEATRRLNHAVQLDPRVGQAWLGRFALVTDDRAYALRESLLARGLAVEPNNPMLNDFMGGLLFDVGRREEALVFEQRAAALAPAYLAPTQATAGTLSALGRPREALALLDLGDRRFPDNYRQAWRRLDALLTSGNTAGARAFLDRAAAIRGWLEPEREAAIRRLTYAMDDPHSALADAVVRDAIAEADAKPAFASRDFNILTQLGRTDAALALALRDRIDVSECFRLQSRGVLLSPKFPSLARRAGLWAYWSTTGHWPDICTDPALGWRCPVKSPSTQR